MFPGCLKDTITLWHDRKIAHISIWSVYVFLITNIRFMKLYSFHKIIITLEKTVNI
ncbi:hypothetical protein J2128_001765 [Methanomicrobium sp. W14]|nr:hypothetical protein [Methanomicrobium sp. W14]